MSPEARRWLGGGPAAAFPVLILAAHPDDEIIGAGARLRNRADLHLVHLTDGAPRQRRWWGAPGCTSREEYARLRHSELRKALAAAGLPHPRLTCLGVVDQQASDDLHGITRSLLELLAGVRPRIVLTHPYEGGHPDHDACAFAARMACTLLSEAGGEGPELLEFTSYHADGAGGLHTERFLPEPAGSVPDLCIFELSHAARRRKLEVLACFASQARTLTNFPARSEAFRSAPRYDFTRPPHAPEIQYERFEWGITGREWAERARVALNSLWRGSDRTTRDAARS